MNRPYNVIRLGRNDGERIYGLACRRVPGQPEAGKGEQLLIQMKVVRLFVPARPFELPPAVGGNETSA